MRYFIRFSGKIALYARNCRENNLKKSRCPDLICFLLPLFSLFSGFLLLGMCVNFYADRNTQYISHGKARSVPESVYYLCYPLSGTDKLEFKAFVILAPGYDPL